MKKTQLLVSVTVVALLLPGAFAGTVALQQATATYSQRFAVDYSVDRAIDTDANGSGWAVQHLDGYGAAETAVFETVWDVGWPGGTELVFRLKTGFVNSDGVHNLGRFRLSVTSDDRNGFADGLATDGDVTANWEVLEPVSSSSVAGAILTTLSDSSLLASGSNALSETYIVAARTRLPRITGIRLETMEHDSLPNRGPGRAPHRNFVLVDFSVSAAPVRTEAVMLQQATATYSQRFAVDYSVELAIDADPDSGWAVQHLDGYGAAETAVFETVRDIGWPGGTELGFRLKTGSVNSDGVQNLGRFRLSVTSDDRNGFADGLATDGDVTANWEVLEPVSSSSVAGAILTTLPDSSLLASGSNAVKETYIVVARTRLPRITGIRLETLEHDSLPNRGPGRAPHRNFVLMDFTVSAAPARANPVPTIHLSCVDICWPGLSETLYQVQYSSALTTNRWINLGLPVLGNGSNCVSDSLRSSERRFYRVIDFP